MKRLLSLVLCFALLLSIPFLSVSAADIVDSGICGDSLTWTLDSDGVLTISGTGEMNNYYSESPPWADTSVPVKTAVIESGVTSIGAGAFRGCAALTNVTISESVVRIRRSSFTDCTSLMSVTIPEGVSTIERETFFNCSGLMSIAIPASVTSIEYAAFYKCTSLTNITIPASVTNIGDSAFQGCTGLTSITIPGSVTSIGRQAFLSCTGLTRVNILNGVTSIGSDAFQKCTGLTGITIPASVTKLEGSPFLYCNNLTGIWVDTNNTAYCSDEHGVLYNKEKTELLQAPARSKLGNYIIPDGVTRLQSYAFRSCTFLIGITIPGSLTDIWGFEFSHCTNLANVTILNGVERLCNGGFFNCTSLKNIFIPESVTSIERSVFDGCTNLTKILVDTNNPAYSNDNSGVLFSKDKTELICCPNGFSGEYAVPKSVTSIKSWAFSNCSGLTSINLPESVTSIEDRTFYGCSSLTSIIIPESVTSIGWYAFEDCIHLASVCFMGAAPKIKSAFRTCTPGEKNYYNIPGLTLYYIEGKEGWTSPTYGEDEYPTATWDGKTVPHKHNYQSFVTAPTCTAQGYTTHTCSTCSDSYKDTYTNALGHSYGYKVTTTPTASAAGKLTGTCSRCSATTTVTLPKLNTTDYTYSVVKAATCTATGTGRYIWKTTAYGTFQFDVTLAKTNHSYKTTVTAPTCTAQGYTTHTCSACGDSYKDTYTNALGHSYGYKVTTTPTASAAGKLTGTCSRCSATTTVTLPKLNTTDYTYSVVKAATCTATGTGRYIWKTTAYGTFHFDVTLAKTNHSYKTTVTAPTCTAQGYTTHTCSACGDSYKDSYIAATGHAWDNGVETEKATCTQPGTLVYTCANCGKTRSEEVSPTGHTYVTAITAPTCTAQGYTTHTCACGESYKDAYTDALGHNYKNGICTRCGAKDPSYKPDDKPVETIEFSDVSPAAWYAGAVDYAVSNKLMNGMGGGKFEPNGRMTRAMLVTVLWRYAGSPAEGTNGFSDVPNGDWYTQAVAWASKNGVVNGVGNGRFDPNGKITREQMAVILFRYANQQGINTGKRGDFGKFADANRVSSYAVDALQWAVAEGIVGGSSEGGKLLLNPQGNATRAEVATILMRFLENVMK